MNIEWDNNNAISLFCFQIDLYIFRNFVLFSFDIHLMKGHRFFFFFKLTDNFDFKLPIIKILQTLIVKLKKTPWDVDM